MFAEASFNVVPKHRHRNSAGPVAILTWNRWCAFGMAKFRGRFFQATLKKTAAPLGTALQSCRKRNETEGPWMADSERWMAQNGNVVISMRVRTLCTQRHSLRNHPRRRGSDSAEVGRGWRRSVVEKSGDEQRWVWCCNSHLCWASAATPRWLHRGNASGRP